MLKKHQILTMLANLAAEAELRNKELNDLYQSTQDKSHRDEAHCYMTMRQHIEDAIGDVLNAKEDASYYFI